MEPRERSFTQRPLINRVRSASVCDLANDWKDSFAKVTRAAPTVANSGERKTPLEWNTATLCGRLAIKQTNCCGFLQKRHPTTPVPTTPTMLAQFPPRCGRGGSLSICACLLARQGYHSEAWMSHRLNSLVSMRVRVCAHLRQGLDHRIQKSSHSCRHLQQLQHCCVRVCACVMKSRDGDFKSEHLGGKSLRFNYTLDEEMLNYGKVSS